MYLLKMSFSLLFRSFSKNHVYFPIIHEQQNSFHDYACHFSYEWHLECLFHSINKQKEWDNWSCSMETLWATEGHRPPARLIWKTTLMLPSCHFSSLTKTPSAMKPFSALSRNINDFQQFYNAAFTLVSPLPPSEHWHHRASPLRPCRVPKNKQVTTTAQPPHPPSSYTCMHIKKHQNLPHERE